MSKKGIILFRNDLRLFDNPAIFHAVNENNRVVFLYILDEDSENKWQIGSAQKWWLHNSLKALDESLKKYGQKLILKKGNTEKILSELKDGNTTIYWNRVYEPYFISRDKYLKEKLEIKSYNSSLLYEPFEIKNGSGEYYKVFTHFWKACLALNKKFFTYKIPPIPPLQENIKSDRLEDFNLLPKRNWADDFGNIWVAGENGAIKKFDKFIELGLNNYDGGRDLPAKNFVSNLSPHLHFGEISLKYMLEKLQALPPSNHITKYIAEIGWREFSYHLLYHFPTLPERNFRKEFDNFPWVSDANLLKKWQRGETGYPIVDAGMKELWLTGTMHNRVRMITASFLIKDLLIDWREGARWFWDCLLDADLASNSASWQWVAGSGADSAPYFRIFNPVLQGEKNDSDGEYVKKFLPVLANIPKEFIHKPWELSEARLKQHGVVLGQNYPHRIVLHQQAKDRAMAGYKQIRGLP